MKRSIFTLACVAGIGIVPITSAHADGRSILSAVNTEREMAEIDPLTTDPALNTACKNHASYMNGNDLLTTSEISSNSLFSTTGAWAAQNSVLARLGSGFSEPDPWKNAPFHEFQLMHPWLAKTGVGVSGSYACVVTGGDRSAPLPAGYQLKTVPGTAQFTPPAETASESPFVPGDELGLPAGTKTGPNLLVYAVGPTHLQHISITAATLTSNSGNAVPVRWVDADSPRSARYLTGGAIIVPVHPLEESMGYNLTIEAQTSPAPGETMRISRTTSFVTGPDEDGLYESPVTGDTVTAASNKPLAGTGGTSTLAKPVTLGVADAPNLTVSLVWKGKRRLKATLHCASADGNCKAPLRVLVHRKGSKVQKLRFKARSGPLKINLAPGRTINRTIILTPKQAIAGRKRGFAVRWGGPAPVNLRARS